MKSRRRGYDGMQSAFADLNRGISADGDESAGRHTGDPRSAYDSALSTQHSALRTRSLDHTHVRWIFPTLAMRSSARRSAAW